MDHASYIRGFLCSKRLYVPAIIVMIFTVQQSCVLGYEEIIGFNQNFTSSFDDCSRIVWYPDISEGHNSPPAFRSGPIRNSGLSCVSKMVYGPANINFFWKVSSGRERIGELSFNVDNETIIFCQSLEWSPASYAISPGRHFLSWVYKKQYSYPEYDGVGWIDDIRISYENGTYQQILTGPQNYVFEQKLTPIEQNISLIQEKLASFDSRQNRSSDIIIDSQMASLNENISAIEEGLKFFDSLQNITEDVVFIPIGLNSTLTSEINKYKNKTIILDSGIYHTAGVVINTSDVHIVPKVKWKTVLDSDGAQRGINITNSRNITLESLIIQNNTCGIRIENSNDIAIKGNIIDEFSTYGIRIMKSNNTEIEQNRLSTDSCNDLHIIYISQGFNNMLLANSVDIPKCGDKTKRFLYSVDNSSGNYIDVFNEGYIRENGVKCRIFGNKHICYYSGTMPEITANLSDNSTNIWSFLAYDSADYPRGNL